MLLSSSMVENSFKMLPLYINSKHLFGPYLMIVQFYRKHAPITQLGLGSE